MTEVTDASIFVQHACCQLPPIKSGDYTPKGKYVELNGLNTYVTGPESATHGVLVVYDVFGYWPQTIQGVDILAYTDKNKPYKLFMPDFFLGKPAEVDWFPPDTKEKEAKLTAFLSGPAKFSHTLEKIPGVLQEAERKYSIQKWGGLGYCWGAKIITLASQGDTKFKCIAGCHPLFVDPKDAEHITIPVAYLPSNAEDPEAIEGFAENHKGKTLIKWFPQMVHGWMAARGDFEDAKARGYGIVLSFFHDNFEQSEGNACAANT